MTDPLSTIKPGPGRLLRELDLAPPAELHEVCGAWLRHHLGARSCILLLADYGETTLEAVTNGSAAGGAGMRRYDIADSPAGLAYRQQRTVRREQPDRDGTGTQRVVYLPVTIRTERLGVLVVGLPDQTVTREVEEILDDVAHVIAYFLTGARRYTDRFEMLRRRQDLSLAAEIQWELLPSLAYELPGLSIAGSLEPAYDIGGDTFDYAVSAERLTVSITDAVGHGLRAAMLGSLAVTAMRNARRSHAPILAQAVAANQHLAEQFPGPSWVTGLLMQMEVATGTGVIINAGHPPPLLLRDSTVTTLRLPPNSPLGLSPGTEYRLHPVELRPDDRLLLLTDGIFEAHHVRGPFFGLDRVIHMLATHSRLPPVEFVRHLTHAVMEFRSGKLADDATAVCLDWHPSIRRTTHTPDSPDPARNGPAGP
ncbi:MAG: PP2C family protein-serine/threonine phosphatase [Pseudonocardiaceae bacterium]